MFSSNKQLEPSLTNEVASYEQNPCRTPDQSPHCIAKPWERCIPLLPKNLNEVNWWFSRHANRLNYDVSFTKVKNEIASHSIDLIKKLKYRRRVINKQRAKVSGMYDFVLGLFGKEYPWTLWCLVWRRHFGAPLRDSVQHGGRKRVETSGVYFGFLKTFVLSV